METVILTATDTDSLTRQINEHSSKGWVLISNNIVFVKRIPNHNEESYYHVIMQKSIPRCNG